MKSRQVEKEIDERVTIDCCFAHTQEDWEGSSCVETFCGLNLLSESMNDTGFFEDTFFNISACMDSVEGQESAEN